MLLVSLCCDYFSAGERWGVSTICHLVSWLLFVALPRFDRFSKCELSCQQKIERRYNLFLVFLFSADSCCSHPWAIWPAPVVIPILSATRAWLGHYRPEGVLRTTPATLPCPREILSGGCDPLMCPNPANPDSNEARSHVLQQDDTSLKGGIVEVELQSENGNVEYKQGALGNSFRFVCFFFWGGSVRLRGFRLADLILVATISQTRGRPAPGNWQLQSTCRADPMARKNRLVLCMLGALPRQQARPPGSKRDLEQIQHCYCARRRNRD